MEPLNVSVAILESISLIFFRRSNHSHHQMVRKKHLGISGQHFQKKNILKQDSKPSLNKIMKFRTKWGKEISTDGPAKAEIIKTQVIGNHNQEKENMEFVAFMGEKCVEWAERRAKFSENAQLWFKMWCQICRLFTRRRPSTKTLEQPRGLTQD